MIINDNSITFWGMTIHSITRTVQLAGGTISRPTLYSLYKRLKKEKLDEADMILLASIKKTSTLTSKMLLEGVNDYKEAKYKLRTITKNEKTKNAKGLQAGSVG
jgi:hypothetical protein